MTNCEKLKEIQHLKQKIVRQEELINYYDTMSLSVSSPSYDREVVSSTRNLEAPFVKWIFKKAEAEQVLIEFKEQLKSKKEALIVIIDCLENIDFKLVLTYRYVLDYDWETIASKTNYALSTVYRYHRLAKEEFEKLIVKDS